MITKEKLVNIIDGVALEFRTSEEAADMILKLINKPVETESETLSKVLTKENVKDLINSVNFMYGHGHIYNELITKLQTLTNEQPKVYCKAKIKANKPVDYKDCNCHNFCKFDNIQFDTNLG